MTEINASAARKRVGLYGGSFNPPHICHTLTTLWAMQTHRLDEVWWIPTYRHAFDKSLQPFETRVQMCERALGHLTGVSISRIEQELAGESRTIDTVIALSERHPDHDYALIVGSDILQETDRWKDWDGLMKRVELIVIGRAGYEEDAAPKSTEFRLPNISSTRIREILAAADYESLSYWMAGDVLDFIQSRGLYLADFS